jgi:glycosyltransferase involved in cell wall biosynthesis
MDARMPIRVARIITRLNIGGPSIQAVTLSDQLRAFGCETLLVHGSLSDGEGDMAYLLDSLQVKTASLPALQRAVAPATDVRALAGILRLLRAFKPHIIHTHTAKAGTLGRLAALAYNAFAQERARTVHTYHGHVLEGYFKYAGAFVAVERALAGATDRIVAISPQIARELHDEYRIGRAEQYTVIQLGFDLRPFLAVDEAARCEARLQLDLAPASPVVSIVGRLTTIKQHELFLRIAADVHARRPDATFLVVGDGERRTELERIATQLGIDGAVRFLGWRQDLDVIYGASDVVALTSRNEGTPVALIEALASGVPVVSTDVGGVRDVVSDRVLGRTAPDGDLAALSSAIVELCDPVWRTAEEIAARRASVRTRFSIDRLLADVAALYRGLVTPAL